MIILDNGKIWLEKGEVMPMKCSCGCIYQPKAESEWSICPQCDKENIHGLQDWEFCEISWRK